MAGHPGPEPAGLVVLMICETSFLAGRLPFCVIEALPLIPPLLSFYGDFDLPALDECRMCFFFSFIGPLLFFPSVLMPFPPESLLFPLTASICVALPHHNLFPCVLS